MVRPYSHNPASEILWPYIAPFLSTTKSRPLKEPLALSANYNHEAAYEAIRSSLHATTTEISL
jgi:hypothetical protein